MNDYIKGIWRLLQPVRYFGWRYPIQLWPSYYSYWKSLVRFRVYGGKATFNNLAPVLRFGAEDSQTGGGHYFYQDIWALRKLAHRKPSLHYDIGSRLDGFVGQATSICPMIYVDLRAPHFRLPNFTFLQGDILHLPFKDNSIDSLSCLHTIEHIGLGRYGDAINPLGYHQALLEIQRVMRPGGLLLLSMPVGLERVEFNAQRILDPMSCISILTSMKLLEFSVVNDGDEFEEAANPEQYLKSKYCCGLYAFEKR